MFSDARIENLSRVYNLEPALIRTVAEVESKGSGLLPDGRPVILYEPHIMWRELKKRGIDPSLHLKGNEDILYPKWKPGAYGPVSAQHGRLERAARIDRDCALRACSWGAFQVMAFNYAACGCDSVQAFVNKMYKGDDAQLELFLTFLETTELIGPLRQKDFQTFSDGYNGPASGVHHYAERMEAAYKKFSTPQ